MSKIGIAVDNWKLPIFRARLTEAGYTYEDGGDIGGIGTLLKVQADDIEKLKGIIEQCNAECRRRKERARK